MLTTTTTKAETNTQWLKKPLTLPLGWTI